MSSLIDIGGSTAEENYLFSTEQRKKPLIYAIGIHVIVVFFLLVPGDFFSLNRNIEEIYTVDLFETTETPPAPVQQKVIPPAPVAELKKLPPVVKEPVVIEKAISVSQPEPVSTQPAEIISLTPRLIKKDHRQEKVRQPDTHKVTNALDRLKADLTQQQAELKAKDAQKKAAAAADEAVAKLRDSIRSQIVSTTTLPPTNPSGNSSPSESRGSNSAIDAASKLYFVAVQQQIQSHWILPELQDWQDNLRAVMVVHVKRDGIVTKHYFEEKSSNLFFNKFVEKTLLESLPLPPFPQGLDENTLEIGLVFYPSGLQ